MLWVGVITTSAVFVRNSPSPPMKSIRRFRLTRQTLKDAPLPTEKAPPPSEGTLKDASGKDDDVDFPLGPRLFRKRRPPPETEGHLTIIERGPGRPRAAEETLAPDEEDEEEELAHQPIALDSGDLKIISRTEWEKLETQGEPRRSSRSNGQGKVQEPAKRQHEPQVDADEPDEPPRPVVIGSVETPEPPRPEPPGPEPPGPASPGPAPIKAVGPEAPGKPAAREAPPSQNDAGIKEAAAQRLSRYAMRVGTHDYVLIDDEGHLLKKPKPARQKKK